MGRIIAIGVILLAVGFVVVAVAAVVMAPPAKPAVQTVPPVNVRVMEVRPLAEMVDSFTLPATVEPNVVVRVAAEVAGRIEKVPDQEGRPCKAGDKLVLLNTELLQAEYDRAKSTMEFDAREVERVAKMIERGVATATEYDQVVTRASANRAAYDMAKANLDRAVIVAPISGVLNRVPVEAGEYVRPGDVVAEIVDIDTVKVVAAVPERDVQYLKIGQVEKVQLDALGGREVAGRITYIGELADMSTRTTPIEITVNNAQRLLKSGQIVTVQLERQTLRDVIMVPLAAVIPLEKGKRVYVVRDGKAQPREVELGFFKTREDRIDVRVVKGLSGGEMLIVDNPRYVGPGQAVRVIAPTTAPATNPATAPATEGGSS